MAILITAYARRRILGRCDQRCYNALTDECSCICLGDNHGIGEHKAKVKNLMPSFDIPTEVFQRFDECTHIVFHNRVFDYEFKRRKTHPALKRPPRFSAEMTKHRPRPSNGDATTGPDPE